MGYPGVVAAQHRGVGPLSLARQASCDTGRIVLHVSPRGDSNSQRGLRTAAPDPPGGERRERTCRPGPHRGATPGTTHAVSSTARESNPALSLGRRGPSRSDSGTNDGAASGNCPHASDLASRRASHNTLAADWSSAPDLHRHVTRLQLAAYLFRSSGAECRKRRRRESNARDYRRPRFSGPACYHSSTSPSFVVPPRRFERLSLDS